jgi:dihydroorotate dehydrogenase
MKLVDRYYQQGFRQFHCSNTIPVEEGGLSGASIIPSTSYFLKAIKDTYTDVEIIAGGGIYDMSVYNKYKNLGANHYSISTLFLHPIKFSCFIYSFYNKKL